jgi:hypothetical protein
VIDGELKQYLYKHFDGYPKEVTSHLDKVVDILNGNCDLLMRRLTTVKDEHKDKLNNSYYQLLVQQIVAAARRDIVGESNGDKDIDFAVKTILENVPGVEKVDNVIGIEYLYTVLKEDKKWSYSYKHVDDWIQLGETDKT